MNTQQTKAYAKALGARLRQVRQESGLSLMDVQQKSGGLWPSMVIGSYERADRNIIVPRLLELADFYGVPVADLLPTVATPMLSPADEALRLARRLVALLAGEVES